MFPSELKLARVVPIFKAGDSSALTNYIPISVLPFFAKVFENIVYNKVLNFISDNNILYDHQHGFRKDRFTQQTIITLVDKITKSQDIGDIVITLLIDLKNAFDTIDHRILLRKLYFIFYISSKNSSPKYPTLIEQYMYSVFASF